MRFIINGYEVEIKAKGEYSKRFNQQDTLQLLNTLNIWQFAEAEKAEREYKERGLECYSRYSKRVYDDTMNLHNQIANYGFYD